MEEEDSHSNGALLVDHSRAEKQPWNWYQSTKCHRERTFVICITLINFSWTDVTVKAGGLKTFPIEFKLHESRMGI